MKALLSIALLLAFGACSLEPVAADPLRIFIRAGEKTQAPGAHEYPQFLSEWTIFFCG
jgi:hypothetical protein